MRKRCYIKISQIIQDIQENLAQLPEGPERDRAQAVLQELERVAGEQLK